MSKWTCSICNYVYDPNEGDSEVSLAVMTPFEELPEGWICPVCGAEKEVFIQI
jgi:rubredoxin